MSDKGETLRQAVSRLFGEGGNRLSSAMTLTGDISKPRVFIHDAIHLISGMMMQYPKTGRLSAREEEATALYQAVLFRTAKISRKTAYQPQESPSPTPPLYLIKCITLPDVRHFLENYRAQMGIHLSHPPSTLTEEEVNRHYQIATRFDALFHADTGKYLCEMSVEEIERLPLNKMQQLMGEAIIQVTKEAETSLHSARIQSAPVLALATGGRTA